VSLLEIVDLSVEFRAGRGHVVRAVDGVSLNIERGETVGLVGESGSGKSTLGRAVLGLVAPQEGLIRFDDRELSHVTSRERRGLATKLQAVFQDPYSSLNPARTVSQILAEPLQAQRSFSRKEIADRVAEMLDRVGLPAESARRYPRQFSGGQRQRIAIARALMISPQLVICDEPTSALDLSVQAQILNLLLDLQQELGLSYLFISHDLSVVQHVSHRIFVMYRGQVMESGSTRHVCEQPAHPYTRALLESSPIPDPRVQRARHRAAADSGSATVSSDPNLEPKGCVFSARCQFVQEICRDSVPEMTLDAGREVRCQRYFELNSRRGMPLADRSVAHVQGDSTC
jgi:oligopeptide/dipeptide ABC transporter ATP-binding protein